MEVRHRILQFNNSPKHEQLRKELDRLGAAYKIEVLGSIGGNESRLLEFVVGENDPLFLVIAALIEKYDFYTQTGIHYSQHDIDAAEWVYATAGEYQFPQPEDAYLEATYDTSKYCARCGIGAVQVRPFRLKRDFKQKGSQFLGLHWVFDEIFVRPEIKAMFARENINSVEFCHPVHARSGEDIEGVYQMAIRTVANSGLVTDGLATVTCMVDNEESYVEGIGRVENRLGDYPYCGQVKYHFPQTATIKFRRDSLDGLPDIAKSQEYFGSGAAANRLILMRQRVVRLVQAYRIRGLKFTPIEVV